MSIYSLVYGGEPGAAVGLLEKRSAAGETLTGDEFDIADIAYYILYSNGAKKHEDFGDLVEFIKSAARLYPDDVLRGKINNDETDFGSNVFVLCAGVGNDRIPDEARAEFFNFLVDFLGGKGSPAAQAALDKQSSYDGRTALHEAASNQTSTRPQPFFFFLFFYVLCFICI